MKLLHLNGRLVDKNVNKYRINWDKKSRSIIQFKVKKFLQPFWKNHIVFEEFPVYGSLLKVDILNATLKIAIEINGNQHGTFNKFFHDNSPSKFLLSIKNDVKKAKWLESNGFKIIEIYEDEIDLVSEKFFLDKFGLSL